MSQALRTHRLRERRPSPEGPFHVLVEVGRRIQNAEPSELPQNCPSQLALQWVSDTLAPRSCALDSELGAKPKEAGEGILGGPGGMMVERNLMLSPEEQCVTIFGCPLR